MITATKLYLLLINTFMVSPTQAATMTCLAIHESSLNTQAINFNQNGTIDRGLFQINSLWIDELKVPKEELLTLHTNIRVALHIYKIQGITAWVVWEKCT